MNNSNQEIHLKRDVLERIIRAFFSENFQENIRLIPFNMRPNKSTETLFRCCIYKEREILRGRVVAGLGFSIEAKDETLDLSKYAREALKRKEPEENPIIVIETACKGCVPNRIYVTDLCQGCIANSCRKACKFNAIRIINNRAVIDPNKCKNCKMCIRSCSYNAIVKIIVPCEDACPVNAIRKNENKIAQIDYDVCIFCGRCIMSCPFGAVHEKSHIIDILKNIVLNKKVIALIAPSAIGQFQGTIYQLKAAMLKVGFSDAYEVAQGADITTRNEAKEFNERMISGNLFMTTSCCAGYKQLIKKHLPEIKTFASNSQTPLYYIAQKIKAKYNNCVTVFISPCVAKKNESKENKNVDYVMNFEELNTLFIARNIKVNDCCEEKFDVESSRQGRGFGIVGGVTSAITKLIKEKNLLIKPYIINGLNKETIEHLKKITKEQNCTEGNLIEIMSCYGGCIGGNAAIHTQKIANKAIKILLEHSEDIIE
jgi:[FeFe] hydrogenase (group B1/B3)